MRRSRTKVRHAGGRKGKCVGGQQTYFPRVRVRMGVHVNVSTFACVHRCACACVRLHVQTCVYLRVSTSKEEANSSRKCNDIIRCRLVTGQGREYNGLRLKPSVRAVALQKRYLKLTHGMKGKKYKNKRTHSRENYSKKLKQFVTASMN